MNNKTTDQQCNAHELHIVESDAEQFEQPDPPPTGWPPERIAVAVIVGISLLLLVAVAIDAAVRLLP